MDNNQPPPTAAQSSSYPPQPPYHHHHHHHHHLHLQQQQQQLQTFWTYQRQEIEQVIDFKNHQLPLARIKKIMKADEDVRMISAEAPMLFSKACELFILELTIRSWIHAEENKRRTLQNNDIATAITRPDIFDFLVDIVPREIKEEGVEIVGSTATGVRTIILRRRRVGLIRGCTCRRRRRGNRCGRRRRRIGRMVAEGAVGRSIWMGKVNLLSCRCYVDDAEWHNGRLLSLFLLSGIL